MQTQAMNSDVVRRVDLESWSDFGHAIAEIRSEFGTHTQSGPGINDLVLENAIRFRGQSNSEWALQTTLERAVKKQFSVREYLGLADSIRSEVESLTNRKWPPLGEYPTWQLQEDFHFAVTELPGCDFLQYLRHHGFPSPLLDWSQSPYIAAYFAFEASIDADHCAVFAFIDMPHGHKRYSQHGTTITPIGTHATTHIRHFSQKASYTVAAEWNDNQKDYCFCPHESISRSPVDREQDVLIKITLPRSARVSALKELEDYNIDHYTLFQSEDALVRSLSLREFQLHPRFATVSSI